MNDDGSAPSEPLPDDPLPSTDAAHLTNTAQWALEQQRLHSARESGQSTDRSSSTHRRTSSHPSPSTTARQQEAYQFHRRQQSAQSAIAFAQTSAVRSPSDVSDTSSETEEESGRGCWRRLRGVFDGCWPSTQDDSAEFRSVMPNHMLDSDMGSGARNATNRKYKDNCIKTTKYSLFTFLPVNLFEQFHRLANVYFLGIVILNWMPMIEAFGKALTVVPITFVLAVTALKDGFEDFRRYKSDKKINSTMCRVWDNTQRRYVPRMWSDIVVGDFVHVGCNEIIPADLLLIRTADVNGVAYVETSNLDGESNLKQRQVIGSMVTSSDSTPDGKVTRVHDAFVPTNFRSIIHCEQPNHQIYRFNGFIMHDNGQKESISKNNLLLRGCEIRNSDFVEGVVLYAGRETKAMLNNSGPRYKRSELERLINWDIVWCVVILLALCVTGAIGSTWWLNSFREPYASFVPYLTYVTAGTTPTGTGTKHVTPAMEGFLNFWTFVIVLQIMIPISLYVSVEVVKLGQIFFITQDRELYDARTDKPIRCRALNIPEELGQIQYVLSDKTGTLTENKMIFRRAALAGVDYAPQAIAQAESAVYKEETPADVVTAPELVEQLKLASEEQKERSAGGGMRRLGDDLATYDEHVDTPQTRRCIFESLMNMAICNTVVVNSHPHADSMTKTGDDVPLAHRRQSVAAFVPLPSTKRVADMSRLPPLMERDGLPDVDGNGPSHFAKHSKSTPHNMSNASSDVPSLPPINVQTTIDDEPTVDANERTADSQLTVDGTTNNGVNAALGKSTRSGFTLNLSHSLLNLPKMATRSLSPLLFGRKTVEKVHIPPPTSTSVFEAESPDELALVHGANAYGMSLLQRHVNHVLVATPDGRHLRYDVLHVLPFDSDRKRMSVIVREPYTNQIILYTKGADAAILGLVDEESVLSGLGQTIMYKTQQLLSEYSSFGLRTLCLARRSLTTRQYNEWVEMQLEAETDIDNRDQLLYESALRIEHSLELLGATGIEDRLQDGVPECIHALRHAGIRVWVLTGDKIETAVNIAYASRLFSPGMQLMQLSARSLDDCAELLDAHVQRFEMRAQEVTMQRVVERQRRESEAATHRRHTSSAAQPTSGRATHLRQGSTAAPPLHIQQQIAAMSAAETSARASEGDNAAFAPGHRRNASSTVGVTTKSMRRQPKVALVIDGRTLAFCLQPELEDRFTQIVSRCASVLCCRSTPLQKASIVRLVKDKLNGKTLAIGDGANDVSMIQCADVGVGISGQEGMQAVMSSDFALARFKFLRRLLLVHGHWCYDRLARMVLYFFHKNALFVYTAFWFQLYCGFSGQVMIDEVYLTFYNLIFTALPPLLVGMFDQSASDTMLLRHPRLYAHGRTGAGYRWYSFWLVQLDALWQSIAIYFVSHFMYMNMVNDLWTFGFLVVTSLVVVNQLHVVTVVQSFTMPVAVSLVLSALSIFVFALIYNWIVTPSFGVKDVPVNIAQNAMMDLYYWLALLIVCVVALLPRCTVLAFNNRVNPSAVVQERVRGRLLKMERKAQAMDASIRKSKRGWLARFNKDKTVRIAPTTEEMGGHDNMAVEGEEEQGDIPMGQLT